MLRNEERERKCRWAGREAVVEFVSVEGDEVGDGGAYGMAVSCWARGNLGKGGKIRLKGGYMNGVL